MTTNNTTTLDNGQDFVAEDAVLGATVVSWAINILSWIVAAAIAWSFSGFWMVLLMYLLSSLIMGILALLAKLALAMTVDDATFASLGRGINTAINSVTGLFSRKETESAAI